jgi:hypothetical protein
VEARPHWQQASSCTSLRYCSEKAAFSLPIGHLRTCQLLTANWAEPTSRGPAWVSERESASEGSQTSGAERRTDEAKTLAGQIRNLLCAVRGGLTMRQPPRVIAYNTLLRNTAIFVCAGWEKIALSWKVHISKKKKHIWRRDFFGTISFVKRKTELVQEVF